MTELAVPSGRRRVSFITHELCFSSLVYGNLKLAAKFLAEGHDVDFVGIVNVRDDHVAMMSSEINCFNLKMERVRNGPGKFRDYLELRRPDVVFASAHLESLICCAGARLSSYTPKLVLRSHNSTKSFLGMQKQFFDRHLLPVALRAVAPASAVFAAVSQAGAEDFARSMRMPANRVITLYDPVLPLGMREFPDVLHPWLDNPKLETVVAVGRLSHEKDFPTLLRAFAAVHAARDACRLILVGEGPERARLEALVQDLGLQKIVALVGASNPRFAYEKGSLFACSSEQEGLCNVIVEALSYGMRIVSTDCPVGPAEILRDGRYGLLVPVRDHEALAAAILRSLDLPIDKTALVERAMDFHIDRLWPSFAAAAGMPRRPGP